MGETPETAASAADGRPKWLDFLGQYAAPAAIAAVISAGAGWYTAANAARENQRTYNTKFEELVTAPEIRTAFGGVFVDTGTPTASRDLSKESFQQGVREQQAAATLLSLQSVADSEVQRRTVLLIGARLLNADPGYTSTGGPAARLLTVLIDEVKSGRQSWNLSERAMNDRLWETINAQSFKDLVTAGYSSDYYNDDMGNEQFRVYWPTLNGDAPVTTDAKFQILWQLTPSNYDGWVHLATFGYNYPRSVKPRSAPGSKQGSAQPAITRAVAANFLAEVTDVTLRRDPVNVGTLETQYAIADPRATPPADPRFPAQQLMDPAQFPRKLIMLRHRLLRSRPPVQYINPDGQFRKGSLGRIIGVVPAGSCITVVEPFEPVLVFLPASVISPAGSPKANPAVPNGSVALGGLVHMWAHVRASPADEDCLSVVNNQFR